MVDASFGLFHLYLFVSMYKNRKAKVQLFGCVNMGGVSSRATRKLRKLRKLRKARRVHNAKRLVGGQYVANGAYKCVIDATDKTPCREGSELADPGNLDDYVKIIVDKDTYASEEAKTAELATKLGKVYDYRLLLHLPESQKCAYKYKKYPTLHGKFKLTRGLQECCRIDCKDRDLVVLLSKRGRRLDELYGNNVPYLDALDFLHVLDVGHALWQFSRAGMMHADVKVANMLVVDHLGKLIDFGFSMSYADLLKGNYSPLMGEPAHYDYPYWPGVLRELVGFDTPDGKMAALGKSVDDKDFDLARLGANLLELLESTDKHGFAQTLVGKATTILEEGNLKPNPTWEMFKDLSTTRSVACHNKSDFLKHDPYMDNPFFSWPTIFANLQAYAQKTLGVKVAQLDANYLEAMRPVKSELEAKLRIKLQEQQEEIAAHKAQYVQDTSKKTQDQDVVQIGDEHEEGVVQIGDEHEEDVVQKSTKHEEDVLQKSTKQEGTKQTSATPEGTRLTVQSSRAMPPPTSHRKTKRRDTPTPLKRSHIGS